MVLRSAFLVAATSVITSGAALAQADQVPLAHWQHSVWTEASGPPVPGAHSLVRSPDGYLWLSAFKALLRFDGVRFTVFDSATTPELLARDAGEFVPTFVDRRGAMWISGPGGDRITYRDGRFHYEFTVDPPGTTGPVAEDDQGLIWFSGGKPQRFENGRLSPILLPADVPTTGIWSVRPDTGGGLWLGTRKNGLWHVPRSGPARQYGTGEIRLLIQTRAGAIWAVGQGVNGTARWDGDRWVRLLMPADSTTMFGRVAEEGEDGTIWFQTNAQGVLRDRNGLIEVFAKQDGLSDNRVTDVLVDPTGAVWVSSDAGLDRLRPSVFSMLDPSHRAPSEIGVDVAMDVGGGVWGVDRRDLSVVLLQGGLLRPGTGPLTVKRFPVGNRDTYSLLGPSPRGGVWLKPFTSDLLYLRSDGTRRIFGAGAGVPTARFNGALETRDGTLWLEHLGGFARLRDGKYREVSIPGAERLIANAYMEDGRGRLWLAWGDQSVLAVFKGDSLVARVPVPTKHVDFLALEHGDTIWAASEYGVVRIIDTVAVVVSAPALQRVLAPNLSIGVAEGSLWISSSGGIARVPLAQLHRAADGDSVNIVPQLYDALDGFETARAARMAWRSIIKAPDGRLWINTAAGLAVANPSRRTLARTPPRVLIEEVTSDGVTLPDSARVPPGAGALAIHFTATGLELAERARLEYRLDRADKDWVSASIPRVARYNHLRPGRYVFRVRASNEDGVTGANEAVRTFRVLPAWNQTLWFDGAVFLLVLGLGAATASLVGRQRHRRAQQVLTSQHEATLAERARIAQDLHDTLLQGIAGVSMQLKAAERALPDEPDVAAETLIHVQQLTRETLREARERVLDLQEPDPGQDDLAVALEAGAEPLVAHTGVTFSLATRGERRRLPRALEVAALLIGREAIANAVRHAEARRIHVIVGFEPAGVRIEVRDDGRGFTPEQGERARRRGHLGLSGMQNRAVRAGGTCDIRPGEGGGTVVDVRLPLP